MILVDVDRSGFVESRHSGSFVVLRPNGQIALSAGDLAAPILPRSSNKPLQAVGLLIAGWVPRSPEELAVATSSHSGEPGHLDVVRRVLGDLGSAALACPPMLPLSEDAAAALLASGGTASSLTMNCSGKHAAMLATCAARGWPTVGYLAPDHPLQVAITAGIERLAGERVTHVAVDGCGAPQHALTLTGLARAFGAIAAADRGPERQVADAMRAHPWLVGGTGRDVTLLMEGVPGLVAKDGAEGVYAAGLPDGSAVALKITDGTGRARTPVLVALLRALGLTAPVLDELAVTPVLGGGRVVGAARISAELAGHLSGRRTT